MNETVMVPTGDVFTFRMMRRMIDNGGPMSDGRFALALSPDDVQAVMDGMEKDGIPCDSEYATVSAGEATQIDAWKKRGVL